MAADDQFEHVTLKRLRALEKRYARLMAIVALAAVAFTWREFAYRPEIRSDRFTLVDDAGRARGMWQMRNGNPILVLRDADGNWKSILSLGDDGGGELRLVGAVDTALIEMLSSPEGASISLRSRADDAGRLTLSSNGGNGELEIIRPGSPTVVLPRPGQSEPEDQR